MTASRRSRTLITKASLHFYILTLLLGGDLFDAQCFLTHLFESSLAVFLEVKHLLYCQLAEGIDRIALLLLRQLLNFMMGTIPTSRVPG